MRKIKTLLALSFVAIVYVFTSCGPTDTIPPRLYLTGAEDTVVLLGVIYNDPGIYVEDNADQNAEITVESNIETIMSLLADGRTRRDEDYRIIYTATDQAGNNDTIGRMVRVQNVAHPFAGSYDCRRTVSTYWGDTTYRSTISVDSRVSGKLRISRVYNHYDPSFGSKIYFTINAFLWHPDLSNQESTVYGFLGVSDTDNDTPFFQDMDYTQATDSIMRFQYLKLGYNEYPDSLGNANFSITGSTEQDGITPKSKIEYVNGEISKIVLKYNISKVDGSANPDQVTEEYRPY